MKPKKEPSWLQGVLSRGEVTRTWNFETGETKPVKKQLTLDKFADRCRSAHADVIVAQAVLEDAQNHVVDCQGDLMKAELALEKAQNEYLEAAGEIPGVPVK